MSLKSSLTNRPVIYEIVPPRRDTSRFNTELRGVERVMRDNRIDAINIPELINRRQAGRRVHYSPATIPPEEYGLLVKEHKESIVNIIAPRLSRDAFQKRVHKVLVEYGIKDLVLVGKERHEDVLPGPSVVEALDLVRKRRDKDVALGGICIFTRKAKGGVDYLDYGSRLDEHKRMWVKASKGCDFVTSQINFDASSAVDCLAAYQELCEKTGVTPMTVFLSIAAVPTPSIMSLLEGLDVVVPPKLRRRILEAANIGRESVKVASEVLLEMTESLERRRVRVPIGLQVEQVGVKSEELSMELLDNVYRDFKRS